MNREEILLKSQQENKNQDLYEKEVMVKAGNVAAITVTILASFFFVVQIVVGLGVNLGLYALVFSILAAGFIVKSLYLKRRHEVFVAIMYVALTVLCSVGHIYHLVTASTIL